MAPRVAGPAAAPIRPSYAGAGWSQAWPWQYAFRAALRAGSVSVVATDRVRACLCGRLDFCELGLVERPVDASSGARVP